jgi:hypothetical protein
MAGVVILAGSLYFFNMIMPGTVGDRWFIGCQKLLPFFSSLGYLSLLFLQHWLNILVTKRNPYIEESKHFHY